MLKHGKLEAHNLDNQIIIDSLSNPVWAIDTNYKLIEFNTSFKNAIQYIAGLNLKKGIHIKNIAPDEFENIWKPKYDKVLNGESIDYEYSHNGVLFSRIILNPIFLKDTIIGVSGIGIDISKIKIVEQDLLESYNIINSSPIVVFLWEGKDTWSTKFVSKNVNDLLGFSAEEFLQNKVSYKDLIYPEDFERVNKELLHHFKSNQKKKLIQEYRVTTKKGSIKWVRDFPSIGRDKNNDITYFHGVLQDITEQRQTEKYLKESEKKFKEIFEKSSDALSIIKNGIFIDCNMATCKMLGYSTKEEFLNLNTHPSKLSPKTQPDGRDSFEKAEEVIKSALEKGSLLFEWIHTRKNGEDFPVEVLLSVISNEPNNKVLYCDWRDITKRKRAENELAKYRTQLETENVYLKKEMSLSFNYEDMVYSSLEISEVLTQVEQVSDTDATVLILGETGTGKELIAKAIHNTSGRKNNSLIRVNCAAIPTELIESELFGHIKGSFTGAINNRIGKFELANGGTLFLDEIGEMPLALQPKLLRAIQEGEIEPIGSSKIRKLDVRIIAATNKDLKKEAEDKRFREDLFFRLNVFPITIPPLRKRIEDIPVLVDHFVNKYCVKHRKEIKYISDVTLQQMKSYAWPGNVRELENLIERAVIISNQDLLIIQEFNNAPQNKTLIKRRNNTLEEVQRNHITKILNETQWKIDGKDGAAVLLDINPSTLRDRMKKLGIIRPHS